MEYDITTRDLLIETLIREARSNHINVFEIPEIPSKFLTLIDVDIINKIGQSSTVDKKKRL